jgi:hypothetical protein
MVEHILFQCDTGGFRCTLLRNANFWVYSYKIKPNLYQDVKEHVYESHKRLCGGLAENY